MNIQKLTLVVEKKGRKWLHCQEKHKSYKYIYKIEITEELKSLKVGDETNLTLNITIEKSRYGTTRTAVIIPVEEYEVVKAKLIKEENINNFYKWLKYIKNYNTLYTKGIDKCKELSKDLPELREELNQVITSKINEICEDKLNSIHNDLNRFWRPNAESYIVEHGSEEHTERLEELRLEYKDIVESQRIETLKGLDISDSLSLVSTGGDLVTGLTIYALSERVGKDIWRQISSHFFYFNGEPSDELDPMMYIPKGYYTLNRQAVLNIFKIIRS